MNCEDFNKIIHELADYKPMQVTVRDAGVSHVALCADCATKLASARILSGSLVAAAGAECEEAPARIKQNLLTAFAAVQNGTTKARVLAETDEVAELPALDASVVVISMGRRYRWWTAAAFAVAAVILLAVVLPNWRKASQPPVNDSKAGLIDDSRPAGVVNDKAKTSSPKNNAINRDNPIDRPLVKVKSAPGKRRWVTPRRSEAVDTHQTVAQNTGEYLPLTYLAKSTAIDSGTIVRVELSQSALASLGIRMNFDGTGKSVKADVVIGDDGVAQAIRLVQ